MKIFIAVPSMDTVPALFCQSLALLQRAGDTMIGFEVGSLVYNARNNLARQAVKAEADYVLWLDLLKSGYRAAGCTEILANYRQIPGSRSANKINAAKNRWIIYREYLDLPFVKSVVSLVNYMLAGIKKYF